MNMGNISCKINENKADFLATNFLDIRLYNVLNEHLYE